MKQEQQNTKYHILLFRAYSYTMPIYFPILFDFAGGGGARSVLVLLTAHVPGTHRYLMRPTLGAGQ